MNPLTKKRKKEKKKKKSFGMLIEILIQQVAMFFQGFF
jgi:hypothetical protein